MTYKKYKEIFLVMNDKSHLAQSCIICLQKIQNDDNCRILCCVHIFHSKCIENWLIKNANCPICKKTYETKNDFVFQIPNKLNEIEYDFDCFYSDRINPQ